MDAAGSERMKMKVGELRERIGKSSEENVGKALVFVYKALPKAKKEELDEQLAALLEGREVTKPRESPAVDFGPLSAEMSEFLQLAAAGLYYQPNRLVPKAKRSGWRSDAKRFYKGCMQITEKDPDFERANDLLLRLYQIFCMGTEEYVFSTENPFASIRISQPDFYFQLAQRILASGRTYDHYLKLIDTAVNPGVARDNLAYNQIFAYASLMKTDEDLDLSIQAAKELVEKYEKKFNKKSNFSMDMNAFYASQRTEHLAELVFLLADSRGTLEKELPYYFDHVQEESEVALYIAVMWLLDKESELEEVLLVRDYAVKKRKAVPRKELQEVFETTEDLLRD